MFFLDCIAAAGASLHPYRIVRSGHAPSATPGAVPVSPVRRVGTMRFDAVSRSVAPVRGALAALLGLTLIQAHPTAARAQTHEASQFAVPAGSPDDNMKAAAAFARLLDPSVEISFWDSQNGALSVSRIESGETRCVLRLSPDTHAALHPLGRFLDDRLDGRAQAMFAVAHEVGHCKLRGAFLARSDGRAGDASVIPWLAQEAAADAYGILSAERVLGESIPVRQAVIISRTLSSELYGDYAHATGHYLPDALLLCGRNRGDADAVACALATAYYTAGSLVNDERGSPYSVDSPPERFYELGRQSIEERMQVYDDIAQYKAHFAGADLKRFAFVEVSHQGGTRYITAQTRQRTDTTYRLADYYGFKTGELATEGEPTVTVMRIDGDDELDWLLTLGAVVRTEEGGSLRKGDAQP